MTQDEKTRLAVLETKLDALVDSVNEMKEQTKKTNETVVSLDKRVDGQRLFALGVLGTASTVGGVVGWGIAQFKERIFG